MLLQCQSLAKGDVETQDDGRLPDKRLLADPRATHLDRVLQSCMQSLHAMHVLDGPGVTLYDATMIISSSNLLPDVQTGSLQLR